VARYCDVADLTRFGIRSEALRGISNEEMLAAIDAASDEADGYLGSRYTLPLVTWESDLRLNVARLAVYTLLIVRGFNSSRSGDEMITAQREVAERWLSAISNGKVVPRVTDSSSGAAPGHVSGGVMVGSSPSRGYQSDAGDYGLPFTGRRR
jgi:phage gp36-like protein